MHCMSRSLQANRQLLLSNCHLKLHFCVFHYRLAELVLVKATQVLCCDFYWGVIQNLLELKWRTRACQEASTQVCSAQCWLMEKTHRSRDQNGMNRILLVSTLCADSMAKNKQKGKKQKNVFQVANKHLKNKNKAKPVTTALKHVSFDTFLYLRCKYRLKIVRWW